MRGHDWTLELVKCDRGNMRSMNREIVDIMHSGVCCMQFMHEGAILPELHMQSHKELNALLGVSELYASYA